MGLLSTHESIVWQEFQKGKNTSSIAEEYKAVDWSPAYVSRVLNRARKKIAKTLTEHANSHRLDIETLLDYKGLLIGYDYQTSAQVYIAYTEKLGTIVWYKHDSYAGKLCPDCPKEEECRETLDTIIKEHNISLRADEETLCMTNQSIAVFNKLAAKETPRYKRQGGD
ncbi:MAG: hypothetical protein JSW44_04600 [Candidatus Bathyarchaeota archaeon]|nr:MAG: hypothetical protein JSW44_04600 [Candidatus Bathyarchaeota archaeon]